MKEVVRLAAVADIHYSRSSQGALHELFAHVNDAADILLLCGDLTDYGLPEEAHILAKDLAAVRIPIVGVLGNHDVESDHESEVVKILSDAMTILNGDTVEIDGVGFAGVKGFGGGFGRRALGPWGEKAIKQFVQEALDESMKLETAMARLRTPEKIAVLHYSPIAATVQGEPLEIFPFLGSSRLEEPLIRYRATAVFHGHAHQGSLEGELKNGTPVYNVCLPLLQRAWPDAMPVRIHEIQMAPVAR